MREYIINDSSVHKDANSFIKEDFSIRVGMVREHVFLSNSEETRYIVEVWKGNRLYPMTCIRTSSFGGLYNYEEFNLRGFNVGEDVSSLGNFKFCPGDMVLVAAVNGDAREGVILGCIKHSGRNEVLPATGEIAYAKEFNGLQKLINKDGEYRVTFKGAPTNVDKLSVPPNGADYPLPEYDTSTGFSYYEFSKSGSYLITDNTESDPQSLFIDKPGGKIVITSGATTLTIDKGAESYEIKNKKMTIDATDEFSLKTKKVTIKASEKIEAKATKIKSDGKWDHMGNVKLKGNFDQIGTSKIVGGLTVTGPVSLSGGANPMLVDIVLIQGTGNLGAPVISTATVVKTQLTKAT